MFFSLDLKISTELVPHVCSFSFLERGEAKELRKEEMYALPET